MRRRGSTPLTVDDRAESEYSDSAVKSAVHEALLRRAEGVAELDRPALERRIAQLCVSIDPVMGPLRCQRLTAAVLDEVEGLGPLEPLLSDPAVTEIMLNGGGRSFVERDGTLTEIDLDLDAGRVAHLAQRVVAPLGLRLDRASPIVEARLPDGSRFHAAIPPSRPTVLV